MKIIKLGYYEEAFANEHINLLFADIHKTFSNSIFKNGTKICHYFPKSALLNIIKDQKFYFSDSEFLNDYSESNQFYFMLEDVIAKISTESPAIKIIKDILRMKSMIKNNISFKNLGDDGDDFIYNRRNYVFCCSLDNDCLSNWKYYGKGGGYEAYNFVFEADDYFSYIKRTVKFKGCKCLSGMVIYDEEIKKVLYMI